MRVKRKVLALSAAALAFAAGLAATHDVVRAYPPCRTVVAAQPGQPDADTVPGHRARLARHVVGRI